jgi:hypothetical protein
MPAPRTRSSAVASTSSPLRAVTSLRLGDRVLTRCDDGVLLAEYALFDVGDIVLRATDPVTVREVGYMTTAGEALERLGRAGVSFDLAQQAARALSAGAAASYARGATARSLVGRLGAQELFDGAIFSASAERYEGAWLDLRALSGALPVANASPGLQALHLCAALSEVARSTTLHLATAAATRHRRPGERTHQRVALESASALPDALRKLAPLPRPIDVEPERDRLLRRALVARVRERSGPEASPESRAHVAALESALTLRTAPLGPLADPELRSLERRLAGGQLEGVEGELDRLEGAHGQTPGLRYLRARARLLRGGEPLRGIAQVLSELAEQDRGFHEAALVAARTWLAAGEDAHARYFARRLFDDSSAGDGERLVALEILDATAITDRSHMPPAVALAAGPLPSFTAPRVPVFPPLAQVPPPLALPPDGGWDAAGPSPPPPRPSSNPPAPATLRTPPPPPDARPSPPPPADARPSPAPPPPAPGRLPRYEPELVETLALPFGASESSLDLSELPKTPLQARIALTRLARDLARDYRLGYGKALRCNVLAIDAMQQHLVHRFGGASVADPAVAWELRRHGALLSEIIARALGGAWVDVGPSEPGFWAMSVLPSLRTFPIGRVYRFVALGHRERDLVGYYLDLEARVRKAAEETA